MQNEQVVLKPCPFCGENAEIAYHPIAHDDPIYVVGCVNPNCLVDAEKPSSNRVEAITAWNTRALEASQAGAGDVGLHEAARDLLRAMLDGQERVGYRLDLWSRLEAALTTPTRIEAAQVDVDANRKVALRNLEKSGLRAPQAAQPQEAVTQVFEARHCPGIPTDCCDFGVISHATGKEVCRVWDRDDAELIARLFNATPPQAAESGLLDEAQAALNVMTTAFAGYADTPAKREAVALADALLTKAGKPGEAGNG